jgi:two-component system phosphate regulon sensor histidine kinase PhoR
MTARIFVKLILAIAGVLAVALTAVYFIATPQVHQSFVQSLERELLEKARSLELTLPRDPTTFPRMAKAAGARLTWVAPDGRVLADSDSDPARMENHAGRPEIAEALQGRTGFNLRRSPTVGIDFYYLAIPVFSPTSGSVLRVAVPAAEVDQRVRALSSTVLFATALAFLPAALLAGLFARLASNRLGRIIDFTRTLTQGNFSMRLKGGGKGEFGLLTANLNETSEKLQFMMTRLEAEHTELEKLERVRKDFVINVSHELRTPLASIQGYTETLLDGALNEPANAVKFLQIIRQNTERLTRLTADLLVLSRIELAQQKFKFASYSVNRLLADNVDSMQPLARRKGITLHLVPAPDDAEVFADAEAVHQILTNLLENAIKYTPDGGSVTIGARPAEPARIEFFVQDTGIGIPPEDLARLFERFYRVDKARSRALGGTGLGLAIVKHLTRAQGGEVRVESHVDRGSTFFFTLPVNDLGLDESGAVQQELTVP